MMSFDRFVVDIGDLEWSDDVVQITNEQLRDEAGRFTNEAGMEIADEADHAARIKQGKERLAAGREKVAEELDVPVDQLLATQDHLVPTVLAKYRTGAADPPGKPVKGVRVGDRVHVLDGHHRVAAKMLSGERSVRMLVSNFVPTSHRLYQTANAFCPTGEGGGQDNSCAVGKGKFVGETVGHAEKVRADEIEKEVAKAIRGEWEEDSKAYDAKTGSEDATHFVEVKSKLKGKKPDISVHDDALLRKVELVAAHPGSTFHTVVVDERDAYGGGQYAQHYSGHRMYYKRGSGRYVPSQMQPVRNAAELRKLIAMPDDELPDKAKGSLPSGKQELRALRESAAKAHEARLAKDRARKERLKAEGKSAYERQT